MVINDDVFNIITTIKDKSISFIFSDVPYNMGSKYCIDSITGKPKEIKLSEFMGNKWDGLTCDQLEIFFNECYRMCKYGAYVVIYGIDRVQMPFEYFACKAGFEPQQYLYSYKISSFPKSADVSKMIDNREGVEREIIGDDPEAKRRNKLNSPLNSKAGWNENSMLGECPVTAPTSNLAKKYDGYKTSISPFKQTLETIMVFKKLYPKGMSTIDAIYAYEGGNKEISPSIINIDGGRVSLFEGDLKDSGRMINRNIRKKDDGWGMQDTKADYVPVLNGARYPSQLFIVDDERLKEEIGYNTSDILDEQSGELVSGDFYQKGQSSNTEQPCGWNTGNRNENFFKGSRGGYSRINHKCNYTEEEYNLFETLYDKGDIDLLRYCTKVSGSERQAGCEEMDEQKYSHDGRQKEIENPYQRNNSVSTNNHPTLKSLELNHHITKLFIPPKENFKDFTVFNPFSGSGSEYIGLLSNGVLEDNIIACELNENYFEISKKRIKYWRDHNFLFKKENRKEFESVKKEVEEGKKLINQTKKLF